MLPTRRLRTAFADLRWGHIAVELVLLIAGILIALAVNNWMEDRRDARLERQYLERLVRDFDADLALLEGMIDFEQRQIDDGVLAWRALSNPASIVDRAPVAVALSNLCARRTLRLSRAAYTDLTSTGNLRLIRNSALRDNIVGLYEANDRIAAIIDRNNQFYVDQLYVSLLADGALVARRAGSNVQQLAQSDRELARRVGASPGLADDRLWSLGPDSTEWREVRNMVWTRMTVSMAALNFFETTVDRTLAARAAVVSELQQRWPGTAIAPAPSVATAHPQPAAPAPQPALAPPPAGQPTG